MTGKEFAIAIRDLIVLIFMLYCIFAVGVAAFAPSPQHMADIAAAVRALVGA